MKIINFVILVLFLLPLQSLVTSPYKEEVNNNSSSNFTKNLGEDVAFCLLSRLPTTGLKRYGEACSCSVPGPNQFHGYVSTCNPEQSSSYCQEDFCMTTSQCCYTSPQPPIQTEY